jgi:hypothetical protein
MSVTSSTSRSRTTVSGRMRRLLASAVALVGISMGLLAGGPTEPASAATGYGQITACFSYSGTGSPWTEAVTAWKWTSSGWAKTSTLKNYSNGCRTWSTVGGTYFSFSVYQKSTYYTPTGLRGSVFSATSPVILSQTGYNTTVRSTVYSANFG